MPWPRRVVVCGTGTGVGKTYVSCALIEELRRQGVDALGLKPVESGWTDGPQSDAAALGRASGRFVRPAVVLQRPVSPHLAAREEGVEIALDALVTFVQTHRVACQVIETAGGLMSPLARGVTNRDLMLALEPDAVVLVCADRLGMLHDVGVCLEALRVVGVDSVVVVASEAEVTDASTGGNGKELEWLGVTSDVITVPRHGSVEGLCELLQTRFT